MKVLLDANATTPLHPEVLQSMMPFLTANHANPSSVSREGKAAKKAIEIARAQVAEMIGSQPEEIIFCSGGTEAIHSALATCSQLCSNDEPTTYLYGATEHPALIEGIEALTKRLAHVHSHPLGVTSQGLLEVEALETWLQSSSATSLHTMWVNNETGVVHPMAKIKRLVKKYGLIWHVDAVQALGKIPISVSDYPIDLMSMSAHKIYGPKGVGALFVSRKRAFQSVIQGSQELGRRGGTENVAGIVGFGKACEIARLDLERGKMQELEALRNQLETLVEFELLGTRLQGKRVKRVGNTSLMTFEDVKAAELVLLLEDQGLIASTGAACQASSRNGSHVLLAMGCSADEAKSGVRFSFTRDASQEQVYFAAHQIIGAVNKLRSLQDDGMIVSYT